MDGRKLSAVPITKERFAAFGDVLYGDMQRHAAMNDARFIRFRDLAMIDIDSVGSGRPCVSIARCRTATKLPYRIDLMERHPLGSQLFMPLAPFSFIVVVAPAGESVDVADLQAFVTTGREGINYHKGVWHMPMIGLETGQDFLIIDRIGGDANCDEVVLSEAVTVDL